MKKLFLRLEDLSIDSFETLPQVSPRGTVRGNASEPANTCGPEDLSYPGSCDPFCDTGACPTRDCTPLCPPLTREITCYPTGPDPVNTCCGGDC